MGASAARSVSFCAGSREALRFAWVRGYPIAIWGAASRPEPSGVVSLREPSGGGAPVFGRHAPAFVFSRFDVQRGGDGRDVIEADVVVEPSTLRFVASDGSLDHRPTNAAQADFVRGLKASGADAINRVLDLDERRSWPDRLPYVASREEYQEAVGAAVKEIRGGALQKVVLSRVVRIELHAGLDLLTLFDTLREAYPQAFVCLVSLPNQGVWVTATPETLLEVDAQFLRTMALAGTQAVSPDTETRDVLWSDKFIQEQALVSSEIRHALHGAGFQDFSESGPGTVRAGNLVHLRTDFTVQPASDHVLPQDHLQVAADRLLEGLHPTPAVCGIVRESARRFIQAAERHDRDRYTGYLGPVGSGQPSTLYVNLRCAQIIGSAAYLYVGAGIVGSSSPEEEFEETVQKSKTLGALLERL